MNYRALQDSVLDHFNGNVDGPSAARTRIGRSLNEWHRRILSKPGFERFRQSATTATTTASVPSLTLPAAVSKILRIYETTNRITLEQRFFDWYRFIEPSPTDRTGQPEVWVPMGTTGCGDLGTAGVGTGLWAVSSSASDTARVYIEGVRVGGVVWSESAKLNGTTRAQFGSLTDWVEVTKFNAESPLVGKADLYKVATLGTSLATIPLGHTEAVYQTIALWPTPDSAYTLQVDYERASMDMVNDADTPLLPEDFHHLLLIGARVNEYERTDDDRLQAARADLEKGIGELRATLHTRDVPVPGRTIVRRISRINGWSPADTTVVVR